VPRGRTAINQVMEIYYRPDYTRTLPVPLYPDDSFIPEMKKVIDKADITKADTIILPLSWRDLDQGTNEPSSIEEALNFGHFDVLMEYSAKKQKKVIIKLMTDSFLPQWYVDKHHVPQSVSLSSSCDICDLDSYGYAYNTPAIGNPVFEADYAKVMRQIIARYKGQAVLVGWEMGLGP
jgi:hypothetical protein